MSASAPPPLAYESYVAPPEYQQVAGPPHEMAQFYGYSNIPNQPPGIPIQFTNTNAAPLSPPGGGPISPNTGYIPPYQPVVNESSKPKEIKWKDTNEGVKSRDPTLNHDSTELLNFFIRHCTIPQMYVRIHGTHIERRQREVVTTDQEGRTQVRIEHYDEVITDFLFSLNVSQFIAPQATIYTVPDQDGRFETVQQLLDRYITSTNNLKTIKLRKIPVWNYGQLTNAILGAIHSAGYYMGRVSVTFPMLHDSITVKSDSEISKFADNKCVRFLCCISCLCIIFYPIYRMAGDRMENSLRADFAMTISDRDWFYQNYGVIMNNVARRLVMP